MQQKQDEYVKQLAPKVDVLTTHNMMFEAQITQHASFSPVPSNRVSSEPESNPMSIVIMLP